MDKKYKELFSKINDILVEQKEQKKRGLNDYNMVNVVRKATHEVGMHSNVIFSLIDPNGLHYQDDLFLKLFIEHVLDIKDFGTVFEVQKEEQTGEGRRIDFTIKSDKYFIGIEMKVNATDLKDQISDYEKDLKDKSDNQTVLIYYLTKYGKEASKKSAGETSYTQISFETHILKWIEACKKEVRNITNLNEALENYKNIVKKITKQYKGNVVSIAEELLKEKNKESLKIAMKLDKEMDNIKSTILWKFFDSLKETIKNQDIIDISSEMQKQDYIATSEKCKKSLFNIRKNGCTKTENFGWFFDCGLKKKLYLHVELATSHLHYGLVKCTKKNNSYEILPMTGADTKEYDLDEKFEYRQWKRLKWYSVDCGIIIDFNEKALTDYLLNPENLKNKINELLQKIKTRHKAV